MLTVRGLVSEMGLELTTGDAGADAPVRWVHISELPDPTPWLSGGELLLTTGIQLDSEKRQREFVRLLAGHHLSGLGFGIGFDHDTVPAGVAAEAEELGFPVFEVPYELPFIALTEKAFTRLVNEQYEVLQRGIAIHKRLERLVLEESGLDEVVRALAAATGGAVCVFSGRGETISSKAFRRALPEEALEHVRQEVIRRGEELSNGAARASDNAEFAPDHPEIAGRALVLPVSLRGRGAPQAWLVAARDTAALGDFERLILQQAVTVVALELMRQRAMRDTERRLAGDVLAEALTGRLSEEELAMRLRPFGIGHSAAVLVFSGNDGAPERRTPRASSTASLADAGIGALVATRERLLCAVVDAREGVDPVALAATRAGRDRGRRAWRCGPRRRAQRPSARCGEPSTRRAARSRPPRSPTARRPPWRRTGTSAHSSCSCRFRTTTRCGCTATACSARSRTRAASTATS